MFLPVPPDVRSWADTPSVTPHASDEPAIVLRRPWRLNRTFFLGLVLLVACGGAGAWYLLGGEPSGPELNEFFGGGIGTNGAWFGELVNQTRDEIEQRYGNPENEWEEFRPLGSRIPQQLPEGRIKTLLFHGRGGLNNREGTVIVWLVERPRGWVCFESTWFGGNVLFP